MEKKKEKAKLKKGKNAVLLVLAVSVAILGSLVLLERQSLKKYEAEMEKVMEKFRKEQEEKEEIQSEAENLKKQVEELMDNKEDLEEIIETLNTAVEENGEKGTITSSGEKNIFSQQDNGYLIVLDAGHQGNGGDSEQEPVGPGASETKAKDTGGTQGVSGYPEYALNLVIAEGLKGELESRGYQVIMTRESNDIRISNIQRAAVANENHADVFLRIHANGDNDSSVKGALSMAVSENNPYVNVDLSRESQKFSQILIDAFCEATGASNRGVMLTDTMSGLNWSQVPSSIIEMGFMSNPEEDAAMQTSEYQEKMIQGMANGIDRYLGVQ